MEKIDIRKLSKIGVSNIKQKASSKTEKVKLRIGVFFDGTGNNRYNSDQVYYNPKYSKLPLDEKEIKESKINFKSFIIESGSSYWNSYSNVALLYDLYEENRDWKKDTELQTLQLKFYIEGIGTLRQEEDTTIMGYIGAGMGEGKRGVISRVEETCNSIAEEIEKLFLARKKINNKHLEIVSMQFDVFGFSRGAAAARHFCNEVLKTGREEIKDRFGKLNDRTVSRQSNQKNVMTVNYQAEMIQSKADATKKVKDNLVVPQKYVLPSNKIFAGGLLGKLLKKKKIGFPKHHVSIEFLGIFDTVISQMLERKGIIDTARNPITGIKSTILSPVLGILTEAVALIKKVNPDLSNPNIKRVLHLTAQTEWRDNFPVTPVGKNFNGICSREVSVLGAHSDIGGAYWQTEKELHTLHFFDLGEDASLAEKQKLEQQKDLLRNWYISQKLCNENQLYWEVMHHVHSFEGLGGEADAEKNELLPESFMEGMTKKTVGNWTYLLKGSHHKLCSERPLNNKLSLVYMNVMKYIAINYADVPFLEYTSPKLNIKHAEEYKYPEDYNIKDDKVYELKGINAPKPQNKKNTDLEKYQNLIIKIAEHGWMDKEGKEITYPELLDEIHNNYPVYSEMYKYIMGKFVHLSANFDSPLADMLKNYNFAYANVPHFIDEKDFKNPPYERQLYTPELAAYDIH